MMEGRNIRALAISWSEIGNMAVDLLWCVVAGWLPDDQHSAVESAPGPSLDPLFVRGDWVSPDRGTRRMWSHWVSARSAWPEAPSSTARDRPPHGPC